MTPKDQLLRRMDLERQNIEGWATAGRIMSNYRTVVLQDFTPPGFRTTSATSLKNLLSLTHNLWFMPHTPTRGQCSSWELLAVWKPYVLMSNFHKMNCFAYELMDFFISMFKLAYGCLYERLLVCLWISCTAYWQIIMKFIDRSSLKLIGQT